jgi:hypothetical protein
LFSWLQEELRAFFPLSRVIEGLFSLGKKLFGINIYPADGLAPVIVSHPKIGLCIHGFNIKLQRACKCRLVYDSSGLEQ